MTDCPPSASDELRAENERLQSELATARETNRSLNRRCQLAERAASEKVTASTGSLGRGLANYAASMYARELTEAREENDCLNRVARAAQDLETYLIDSRWFDETEEPALTGFPTAELAMLSDALDSLELRPDTTTTAGGLTEAQLLIAENERLRVVFDAALVVYRRHDDEIQSNEWDDLEAALVAALTTPDAQQPTPQGETTVSGEKND